MSETADPELRVRFKRFNVSANVLRDLQSSRRKALMREKELTDELDEAKMKIAEYERKYGRLY